VLILALIVAIMAIRKRFFTKVKAQEPVIAAPIPVNEPEKPAAPGSAGQIKIHNVPPKTAAMLMAIVANKMNKPLNELRFISIKEVE
jgi:3-oxoacyl-ACP reductase-like protein